ncbi:MAG: hypothetical protein D6681_20820 [Calditrichaeota bacterium]|nr:MAG: hypothetical protein D6681_20820 [Calditrichota bacterium]
MVSLWIRIVLMLSGCFIGSLLAQEFSGQFFLPTDEGEITLTFQSNAPGNYTGELSGKGNSFPLRGVVQGQYLVGTVGDEQDGIVFQAQWNGDYLVLTMAETDAYGNVLPQTAQRLVFQQRAATPSDGQQKDAPPTGQVIINNVTLTPEQIAEIEQTYGVRPRPGKYWYDARSGLYGVVGYPAYGFMLPGHKFGTLNARASNGNTGVFVNGRELPVNEYTVWSYIVGNWIQPGRYWLDAQGNAGYEGNPVPVINLYAAAQQRGYTGQGASGDNFWSSRFSAGNYDSGNTRGYVSVPGYGPVGYGF